MPDRAFLLTLSDDAIKGFVNTCVHNRLPVNKQTACMLVVQEIGRIRCGWRVPWLGELWDVLTDQFIQGDNHAE